MSESYPGDDPGKHMLVSLNELERAERERDEARAEVDRLRAENEALRKLNRGKAIEAENLRTQREALRAELEDAKDHVAGLWAKYEALREAGERLVLCIDYDPDNAIARWRKAAGPTIHPDAVTEGCVEC